MTMQASFSELEYATKKKVNRRDRFLDKINNVMPCARCEFQFCPTPPRTGAEAEAAMDHALERLIHLSLLNQGVLITPFHNMMLVCPDTPETAITALVDGVEAVLEALRG